MSEKPELPEELVASAYPTVLNATHLGKPVNQFCVSIRFGKYITRGIPNNKDDSFYIFSYEEVL